MQSRTVLSCRDVPRQSASASGWFSLLLSQLSSISSTPDPIQRGAHTQRAFFNLTERGVNGEYLAGALRQIESLAGSRSRLQKRKRNWALPPSMTGGQLARLPSRIEDLAAAIEQVNSHKLFNPSSYPLMIYRSRTTSRLANTIRIARLHDTPPGLSSVPTMLRAYGTFLEKRIKQVKEYRRGPAKGTELDVEIKNAVLRLVATVEDETGKHRWTDLVNLLSPLLPKQPAWIQDADALRSFYQRNRHLLEL